VCHGHFRSLGQRRRKKSIPGHRTALDLKQQTRKGPLRVINGL
jgi:hypothetical protein